MERTFGESVGIRDDLIRTACTLSMAVHSSTTTATTAFLHKPHNSSHTIFAFSGSWSVDDWFAQNSFGDLKIDLGLFPSLRSVGNDETAVVNGSFLRQFNTILRTSQLQNKVERALLEKKQIVFSGHSSGGPIAILATIWLLEQHMKLNNSNNQIPPICVTFGSPLVGDRVFSHALRRENWSRHFIHFVTRYDIVPRILLSPRSSFLRELQTIFNFFNPRSQFFNSEYVAKSWETPAFFRTVMRNALTVASHAACSFMGCTNLLLEAVPSFIEISPYRPFGTYVFSSSNKKLITSQTPDAILQLLFYCLQLDPEQEVAEIAYRSLNEHLIYETRLRESLETKDVVNLDNLEKLPFSSKDGDSDGMRWIDMALDDFGLSTRARICLSGARELDKQKQRNQDLIDANRSKIRDGLAIFQKYQANSELCEVNYYDAFKLQKDPEDFYVNVKRLELAGIWDEIVEMLRRYALPDSFEGRKEWVELGTMYRRLVEPLDIANYYRHFKNEDTGPYMIKGRPKRYKYTQRWLEHALRVATGSCSESCFWAEVEELCNDSGNKRPFKEVKERVMGVEALALKWITTGEVKDVFLKESTFVKWWTTLPHQHREVSQIARFMEGEGRSLSNFNQAR